MSMGSHPWAGQWQKKKTKKGAKMIIQAAEKVRPQGKGEKEVSGNIKKNQPNNNTTF